MARIRPEVFRPFDQPPPSRRATPEESRSLVLDAMENLSGTRPDELGPIPLARIVAECAKLYHQTPAGRSSSVKPGTLEMRVLRSLDALVTSDRVIHFKGVGYRLKTSESVEAALDRAIRRLEQVRLALKLPPESSPRWTDSAWMYARWAIVDAAPIVESELAKKGVNPPSEPSHLRLVQDDAVNAHLEVTLRGSNLSVPEDLRALGEEAFAGGIKDQLAEKCVLCNMPLPHEGKHAEFHRLIEERLPLVRDFDPLGNADRKSVV